MNNSIKVFGNTHKDDPWRQAPIKGSTKFCVVSKNDVIVELFYENLNYVRRRVCYSRGMSKFDGE